MLWEDATYHVPVSLGYSSKPEAYTQENPLMEKPSSRLIGLYLWTVP